MEEFNKAIALYNSTVRKDCGIYLTKEHKEAILEFIESKVEEARVSCKGCNDNFKFYDYRL